MSQYPANWSALKRRVFRRDGYQCRACGRRGGSKGDAELHAHHLTPVAKGGDHTPSNLITLCGRCHSRHHDNEYIGQHDRDRGRRRRRTTGRRGRTHR